VFCICASLQYEIVSADRGCPGSSYVGVSDVVRKPTGLQLICDCIIDIGRSKHHIVEILQTYLTLGVCSTCSTRLKRGFSDVSC
jgi:hypothetical protein